MTGVRAKIARTLRSVAKLGVVLVAYAISSKEERSKILDAFLGSAEYEYEEEDIEVIEEEEYDEYEDEADLDAAYLTTGLLTAGRALAAAHRDERDCGPHHSGLAVLLKQIDSPLMSLLVIENLVRVAAERLGDDDVEKMVNSIVLSELAAGESGDDFFDN